MNHSLPYSLPSEQVRTVLHLEEKKLKPKQNDKRHLQVLHVARHFYPDTPVKFLHFLTMLLRIIIYDQ